MRRGELGALIEVRTSCKERSTPILGANLTPFAAILGYQADLLGSRSEYSITARWSHVRKLDVVSLAACILLRLGGKLHTPELYREVGVACRAG